MEWGTVDAVRWLVQTYRPEEIIQVVKDSNSISRKTANLWANYYSIPAFSRVAGGH
ncbi:hypothetical protein Theth_1431 [Calderihabitans maritimus]|uniref:Uncharacterized protein n=1 Tax=Calderihabitans maritimus TaxID=1246530 RepID=A0A1Z5HW31_9FIRM|nr:hypothetical protein Theth_1431 [Calderihabitans maritimus]